MPTELERKMGRAMELPPVASVPHTRPLGRWLEFVVIVAACCAVVAAFAIDAANLADEKRRLDTAISEELQSTRHLRHPAAEGYQPPEEHRATVDQLRTARRRLDR